MLLHVHEWGDPGAPPLVCLHGVSAHGRRFRKLAEERLGGRFRVLAADLRGHGRSGWDPPWDIVAHVGDVLETVAAAGIDRAAWIGHSFGGRLVLELAARRPQLVERAVLLDPAIQLLPHVGLDLAEDVRRDEAYETLEEAVSAGLTVRTTTPPEFVEEDVREHLEPGADGLHRPRYCRSAAVTMYSELCTPPPAPERLGAPALLVHAPDFGLVLDEQLAQYEAAGFELLAVRGGHVVYWDAWDETAAAIDRFLSSY
jgi:lipase